MRINKLKPIRDKFFNGKKVLVLGSGSSGIAAAKFLAVRGAVVGIYDDAVMTENMPDFENTSKQSIPEAIFVESEKQAAFEKFDFCVISPGISINHKIAKMFEGRTVSEFALGLGIPHKKVVAVTGTNGKTTVTKMIAAALGGGGIACGNIGTPVTEVARQLKKKTAAIETSSFMLECPEDFIFHEHAFSKINIGVILNITQDHLERHGSMQEYIKCKAKLGKSKRLILNYDDENCRNLATENSLFFSMKTPVRGIYVDGEKIVLNLKKRPKVIFSIEDFQEEKPHMIANILAAVLVCRLLGIRRGRILRALTGLKLNDNRIQCVRRIDNVTFYNDSKATNIAACLAACKVFRTPINLLVGGQIKGQNFAELFEKLPSLVEHVFCFGSGAETIMNVANSVGFSKISRCSNITEAVNLAFEYGFGPRVVLLSPACASLDEYKNYAERGKKFAEDVQNLAKKKERSETEPNQINERGVKHTEPNKAR